jgi:dolichol-phosphate mannosyltransferase
MEKNRAGGTLMKIMVIVPTYNERNNIEPLVNNIFNVLPDTNILVVDDNSPDGTGELADGISRKDPRVRVLHRPSKMGLGKAYIAGFKYALSQSAEYIFEMDADFSHDPAALPAFMEKIKEYDVVIGSRYIKGISVVNWPLRRLILSLLANLYVRLILHLPVKDATAGFKCFRRKVLEAIDLDKINSNGYAFQIEMNYMAKRTGFTIAEIPIIFNDRHVGSSKMSRYIVWEALFIVWRLRWGSLFKRKT